MALCVKTRIKIDRAFGASRWPDQLLVLTTRVTRTRGAQDNLVSHHAHASRKKPNTVST